MSDEKQIIDFWENKHLYLDDTNLMKSKAREYYTEEFINDYSKWSKNVLELNTIISTHMEEKKFPMKFWKEMSFDWFCKTINNLIEEWIINNKDITLHDVNVIMEKLIADYISIQLTEYEQHANGINELMESIKRVVMI